MRPTSPLRHLGLWAFLGLAAPAHAGPPTDDWGRAGTTKDCQDNCRVFEVNAVILSPISVGDPQATMQGEVDRLNEHFRTEKGYQLFQFELKRVTPYEQVQTLRGCPKLKALGHLKHKLDAGRHHGERRAAIEECFRSERSGASTLFDHHAINLYVFDNHDSRGSSGGAYHTRDKRWPYVFIDRERLGHVHAVEEHEMGHALGGLEHVCRVDVAPKGPTPIMATPHRWPGASSDCRDHGGRMGDRSIGFSDHTRSYLEATPHREITQLTAAADQVQRALGPEGSPPPASPPQW